TLEPPAPGPGTATRFVVWIRTDGSGTAYGFRIRLTLDDSTFWESGRFTKDGNRTVGYASPSWNATSGNHTVRAFVDPDNAVNETDETNNERIEGFVVPSPPPPPPRPPRVLIYRLEIDLGEAGEEVHVVNLTLGRRYTNVTVAPQCPLAAAIIEIQGGGPYGAGADCEAFSHGYRATDLPPGTYRVAYAAAGAGRVVFEVYGVPA
ncbi:MAG: CARDB domain-containing protein, partial [Methanobacteriota archaeon]